MLSGLDRATRRYKSTWSPTTDNREFTRFSFLIFISFSGMVEFMMIIGFLCRFLFGIVKFSEIIVVPSKKALLLDEVAPKAPITGHSPHQSSVKLSS